MPVTSAAAHESAATTTTGISQSQSSPACTRNATYAAAAAGMYGERLPAKTARSGSCRHVRRATACEDGAQRQEERCQQEREPDRAELGERLEVERMDVERSAARSDMTGARPVEREGAGAGPEHRMAGVFVVPRHPVIGSARLGRRAVGDHGGEGEAD